MNIYEKLQTMRVALQQRNIKKSGNNNFSGYSYLELSDFLPDINEIMQENKVSSFVSFDNEMATLTLVNSEQPEEKIIFTSPMSTAKLKGCHDIQNLGAVQTYERRYLYMNAFEIVVGEELDKKHKNRDDFKKPEDDMFITKKQVEQIMRLSNFNAELCKLTIAKFGYKTSNKIRVEDYEKICAEVSKAAKEVV